MEIRIICVGKINDNSLLNIVENYLKKINHYIKISIIEIKEITFKEENVDTINKSLSKEADILKKYMLNSFNISLCVEAKKIDSIQLSKNIEKWISNSSNKYLNFLIGSSNGLDDSIKKCSNICLSFSDLTIPHQLIRIILLEQIYRSFTIINNIKYHK